MVLCDLDGTLVHSARRLADEEREGAVVVERYHDRDVGFMSYEGWTLLDELQTRARVVPATARTTGQYRRIRFPQQPEVAVVAGGTVVLVDDAPDPTWDAVVAERIATTGTSAAQVAEQMALLPVTEPPRVGDDRFAFVRVAPDAEVSGFVSWCVERDWRVIRQDGRLYGVPAGISKQSAVARVAELCDDEPLIAMGDGLTDAELLAAAPHALTPLEAPLWRSGWRSGTPVPGTGLAVTEALLRAAHELLAAPAGAGASASSATPTSPTHPSP